MILWPEDRSPLEHAFQAAQHTLQRPVVRSLYREQACLLHAEPGPWYLDAVSRAEPYTPEIEAQWQREGVTLVIRRTFVGTCYSNNCGE